MSITKALTKFLLTFVKVNVSAAAFVISKAAFVRVTSAFVGCCKTIVAVKFPAPLKTSSLPAFTVTILLGFNAVIFLIV